MKPACTRAAQENNHTTTKDRNAKENSQSQTDKPEQEEMTTGDRETAMKKTKIHKKIGGIEMTKI